MMCRDGLPMSQARDEAVVGIHFTLLKQPEAINRAFLHVEEALEPFQFKVRGPEESQTLSLDYR